MVAVYFWVFTSSFVGADLLALTGSYQCLFLAIGVVGVLVLAVYWVAAVIASRTKWADAV